MQKKTKKRIWFFARIIIALALIAAAYFLNKDGVDSILTKSPRWGYIFIGFSLTFVIIIIGVVRWRMLLSTQGADVPFFQVFRLNFIGYFFNMFIPGATGGDVVKAYYIAAIYPDKKAEVATTVFLDRFIGLYGLFCVATIALLADFPGRWAMPELRLIIIVLLTVMIGGVVFVFVVFNRRVRESKWFRALGAKLPFSRVLARIYHALDAYRNRPLQVVLTVLLSMLAHVVNVLGNYFYALALGIDIDISLFFFLVPLALFINAIPLTPMGIGIGEMAYPFMFGLDVGSKAYKGASVVVAALMHMGFMVWSLVGTVFYLQGRERIARAIADAESESSQAPPFMAGKQ
jgi:uncharacterized protein (TIRG00374 family)